MIIRRATFSDIPTLVSLNRIVHSMHVAAEPGIYRQEPPNEVVSEAFRKEMELPSAFWLLAEREAPVAFLNAEFRERDETWCVRARRVCYLGGIVVAPHCRRSGIARDLLAALKSEVSSRGVARIELDVWAFNAEAKAAFTFFNDTATTERMAISVDGPNKSIQPTLR